ncbi:(Fe-S)-binding protein [Pelotomaculum propionicicum]|uniref:Anaerobic glycerol-3-phosphate dehydrogenase subunit C n=1 Tax=Pelotomaculum propionicicum TaxID=258475 RepID=A0A4Y7RJ19_9FIRM|nr:(Fe-S)-binding protein [Pelotomaculum propionicicum]TEB08801.1 Anaerobic glycerol-3-phosphate dehydrogenase subunit C [Pelotomaculum propionicicum]
MTEAILAANLNPGFRAEVQGLIGNFDFGNCLACGMCTAGCPYSDLIPGHDPRKFLRKLILGMREEALNDPYVWLCNMCERCTVECPMQVNIANIVRAVRGNFYDRSVIPGFLQKVVQEQLDTGNQMSVSQEDYIETLEWIEEELQEELEDPNYKIPLDKEDTDFMFAFNAREIKYYPADLQAILKVFYAAGFNYTISSKKWDATNLALFTGIDEDFYNIQRPLFEEVVRLRAKELIVTECGHAFRSCRLAYRKFWQGKTFPIRHILQLLNEALNDGRLQVKSKVTEPVTYHDPCNAVRKEGVFEEGRNVLKSFCADFRDMNPNKKFNYCCGGGGGLIAMPEFTDIRVRIKGQRKADQVRATGAKVVAVPCHNCMDQFNDITKKFELGTKNKHVCTIIQDHVVLPEKKD